MLKVRCRPLLWACVLWLSASCSAPPQALAQEATSHQHEQGRAKRTHPPQDMALHEKFYSTWRMPDNPALSCCNNADCSGGKECRRSPGPDGGRVRTVSAAG